MRKLLNASMIYFIMAMVAGVFYREFTKINDFVGSTSLSTVHSHMIALGTLFFLVLALFSYKEDILIKSKEFNRFFILYNFSLVYLLSMQVVKGILQVLNNSENFQLSGALAGISGISHAFITVSFIYFFLILKKLLCPKNSF